ncbi:uncharacterized protein LOC118270796 [Spodoptera frugiperda]|uniref:Uncharacterized protein LOC118270796 n=1 Tax=Spodoptera frugiperda TaxID=7108 RepID=A0A9R0D6V2_SPOFR|nr:uncharacterized protein LOC118270796 [Spodoptera frugiperda]
MTEAQVGFLYNIASVVSHLENNESKSLLQSYYLMRCKEITRGYGLPDKYFATKVRCPKCCLEWKDPEVKINPILLSKRQKKRLKSRQTKENKKEFIRRKQNLVHCNKVEQICTFCKKSTFTTSLKPQKEVAVVENTELDSTTKVELNETPKTNNNSQKQASKNNKQAKKKEINVYTNALDVFSLKNKNNALATKEPPKVIKNNKKKKDKFAGLCQKAVLASAKLKAKEETNKSKLSLFLKPSS